MTCKDCLYQKTCYFEAHYLDRKTWGKYKDGVEKSCPDFQNKTDFVKVVRCKKCKHKVDYCNSIMCGRSMYRFNDGVGGLVPTTPDHFCSYGERK